MTLREQITADVSTVFLNVEDFAESLSYRPKDGTARTIVGVVDELGSFVEGLGGKSSEEFIDVFVSRDATEGVDEPQLGDGIYRAIDGTGGDAKWYSYTGEKSDVDENAWTLRYKRKIPYKHGGNRIQ